MSSFVIICLHLWKSSKNWGWKNDEEDGEFRLKGQELGMGEGWYRNVGNLYECVLCEWMCVLYIQKENTCVVEVTVSEC